jgi:hypothetical protein
MHRSAAEAVGVLCSHLRCDAPQHEGGRAAHFGKPSAARPRTTNLRLWETIAGCVPLFPDCYLQ